MVVGLVVVSLREPRFRRSDGRNGRILERIGELEVVGAGELAPLDEEQVWSLTQFYSVDFSKSRIGVKKCIFNIRTIKVCVSCC